MIKSKNFINGKWVNGKRNKYYYVKNFNNKLISQYPDSDKIDFAKAGSLLKELLNK